MLHATTKNRDGCHGPHIEPQLASGQASKHRGGRPDLICRSAGFHFLLSSRFPFSLMPGRPVSFLDGIIQQQARNRARLESINDQLEEEAP